MAQDPLTDVDPRRRAVCSRLRSDYDGFTMLEVVVSMVIFGVVALIVAGLITNTLRLTSNNT
jgi:prepilin-type N-terminal cleavage/methylation domain-containing protein